MECFGKIPATILKNCNKPLKKSGGEKHVQKQGWQGLRLGACGVKNGGNFFPSVI